jgi:hypothetical protein
MTTKKTMTTTTRTPRKVPSKCARCEALKELLLTAVKEMREMDAEYGEKIYDITAALLRKAR